MENPLIQSRTVEMIDDGLRRYMIRIFNYMGIGLCLTALTAWITVHTPLIGMMFNVGADNAVGLSVFGWIVTFAPLFMVFIFMGMLQRSSIGALQLMFWAYCAVMGLSCADILLLYSGASITRVFLITAATFGSMSLYGYTTKRDLTNIGSFLYMGVWGLIIASIVNMFMHSAALYYALSYISVVIFVGLTAYDMQKLKSLYYQMGGEEEQHRVAIAGALNLYIDFINLFLSLLRIMGDRR
ncbi:MAG: Bax inhibitor-1/YccA family protein [Alphaproteobacteria bacterium]|nr:Bax inhibitor-1/YccA family protein [Alphaproteobacteria bacterium]